jgi:hypothetical protein
MKAFAKQPERVWRWFIGSSRRRICRVRCESAIMMDRTPVTGSEFKQLRNDLGDAIGRSLTAAEMARLCGLPPGNGADTVRRWEVTGPSGPAAKLLGILAMASDRHPILENFNVFDRFNIPEHERPARRQEFREKMRDELRERLGL